MEMSQEEGKPSTTAVPLVTGIDNIETLQSQWRVHFGLVVKMGFWTMPGGGREVVVKWDEYPDRLIRMGVSDMQWETLKLAFAGSGRIQIMSDRDKWVNDLRELDAIK